jgi:hypothetical protein
MSDVGGLMAIIDLLEEARGKGHADLLMQVDDCRGEETRVRSSSTGFGRGPRSSVSPSPVHASPHAYISTPPLLYRSQPSDHDVRCLRSGRPRWHPLPRALLNNKVQLANLRCKSPGQGACSRTFAGVGSIQLVRSAHPAGRSPGATEMTDSSSAPTCSRRVILANSGTT